MQEIIKAVEVQEKVTIKELNLNHDRRIIISEDGIKQSILSKIGDIYFWNHFYVEKGRRTKYYSFEEAVQSRFDKGYKVYVLGNKQELKEMIKHSPLYYGAGAGSSRPWHKK